MKKRLRIIANPDYFTIYHCSGEMTGCYAIYPDEIKMMNEIRNMYINERIPDHYTIKAFKFGKVTHQDDDREVWDILDKEAIDCKVNDIISEDIGFKYCY